MTELEYRGAVGPYFDNYGFFTDSKDGVLNTGNAGLYTGHHFLILESLDALGQDDVRQLERVCEASIKEGQHIRHPEKASDVQSHDDITGLASASHALKTNYRQKLIAEARRNGFSFADNSKKSDLKAWLRSTWDRHPGFTAHLQICADQKPRLFDGILWSISVLVNSFAPKNSTSGRLLRWHWVRAIERSELQSPSITLMRLASIFWRYRIRKLYPNTYMGGVMRIFFKLGHPFEKAMRGKF